MNLKNYLSKANLTKYAPKIIQGVETIAYALITGIYELKQKSASFGNIKYNWAIGHVSDITAAGMLTAIGLMVTDKIKNALITTFTIPTILSILEIVPLLDKTSQTTFDPGDIACYYGGAFAALGIKIASEKIFKKNSQKKDSKNLENIVAKSKSEFKI